MRGISDIIKYAGLTPENCKLVCADTSKNKDKIPEGFKISSPGDLVKTINFYTSTCFEGCDIYDENGRTFIVCDPHKANTLLDISTSMLQICGRIRDSRFRDEMTLIYNTTRYEDAASVEDYETRIKKEVEEARQIADALNNAPESFRKKVVDISDRLDAPFITYNEGQVVIDENMINLDRISYRIIHGLYKTQVNLDSALSYNNFDVVMRSWADNKFIETMTARQMSFKDCCEKYAELKDQQPEIVFKEDERLVRLRNLNPEACTAVDKLGIETIRRMKYHKSNIHKKVLATSGVAQDVKIKKEIDHRLHKYVAYTIPEIKKVLSDVYLTAGLEKAPRATDLERWYRIRRTSKRVYDKVQDAIVIEGDAFVVT